ncbi:putative metalloprotease protein [Rosellinia necatrix]|uniref:Putative metalloprotease protein n=1 Tax=Rosellinia necatrix TaxID=77044 RepID=A0A1S8AAN4_ROSNE|nr:putative metalloprotease protein [Rosellinia necatrix]
MAVSCPAATQNTSRSTTPNYLPATWPAHISVGLDGQDECSPDHSPTGNFNDQMKRNHYSPRINVNVFSMGGAGGAGGTGGTGGTGGLGGSSLGGSSAGGAGTGGEGTGGSATINSGSAGDGGAIENGGYPWNNAGYDGDSCHSPTESGLSSRFERELEALSKRVDQLAFPEPRLVVQSGAWNTRNVQPGRLPQQSIEGRVNFAKEFKSTPTVMVSINAIDSVDGANASRLSVKVYTKSVDLRGFTVYAQSWYGTKLHSCGVSWIAIGE